MAAPRTKEGKVVDLNAKIREKAVSLGTENGSGVHHANGNGAAPTSPTADLSENGEAESEETAKAHEWQARHGDFTANFLAERSAAASLRRG